MVQLMPLHLKTPLSLASFKSRLVLPVWYWPTQVVLEKRLLNGVVIVEVTKLLFWFEMCISCSASCIV